MFYMSARLVVLAIAYIHTYCVLYIDTKHLILMRNFKSIDMKCQCGAGYCPDDISSNQPISFKES